MTMNNHSIGFVGAGNMAQAIMGGLIKTGTPASNIYISEPNGELATNLNEKLGINIVHSSTELFTHCDVIVLAVKPQVMRKVLTDLQGVTLRENAFIVSVAAGLPISLMQDWLAQSSPIIRVMPNTPALVGAGVSGLFASEQVSEAQKQIGESVLRAVGSVVWVDQEHLIDSITAISGSGPAYFFYFIEALEQAALQNGLNAEQAKLLSLETAFGAAKLALESDVSAATLRQRVTSPGGTTQAALEVFKANDLPGSVDAAVTAAVLRAKMLAEQAAE